VKGRPLESTAACGRRDRAVRIELANPSKTAYLIGVASDVTKLSSRGQVVIPVAIRRRLRLAAGDALLVETGPPGERVIILRGQSRDEVRDRLTRAYSWFERTGRDLVEELHESRRQARKRERDSRRP
jgi:AbrB family looped-hinge helix DNA binding protein